MSKYIIVRTFCSNQEIANRIIDTLLSKKLVAGAQVEKISSKYWWKHEIEEATEYKIEFRTKDYLFNEIEREIKSVHNYDVAEISATAIVNASQEFLEWIDDEIKGLDND